MTTFDARELLGIAINWPDGHGNQLEGTLVAAYVVEDEVRVVARVRDGRFMILWLDNCRYGWLSKDDKRQQP